MLVVAAPGVGPGREAWRTVTVDMVEAGGRWLVDGWASSPGPSAGPGGRRRRSTTPPRSGAAQLAARIPRRREGWVGDVPVPEPVGSVRRRRRRCRGWAWDKVIQGIYTWFANGLLLLMEWVWRVLDTASTPRLTEAWFATGLVRPLAGIALAITVALMLASAIQAGFAGRPELIVDALKEGPKAIVATALTVTVMDVLLRGADVLADVVWQAGRADTQQVLDGLARTLTPGRAAGHDVPGAVGVAVRHGRAAGDDGGAVHALVAAVPGRGVRADRVVGVGVTGAARRRPPAGPGHGGVGVGQAGDRGDVGGRREADRQLRHHGTAGARMGRRRWGRW